MDRSGRTPQDEATGAWRPRPTARPRRGDVAAARRLLEQATALDPDRGEPWLKLAAMCRAQGDLAGRARRRCRAR